ncbi:MAG: hypothetical protein PHQ66_01300 [Candidatus Nanoarchaeia archaeon]|nr:hypothetical protein [Candidatus Nanoarchaeia archaeon]MDD5357986.1 hypothetical protein [Candidatus Nanoarchaeia archaeon]MDD5588905.1 hypothetical protein [Candidatus Nanoarchaeia archaeon]
MVNHIIKGIREQDFMTLRWNANIHLISQKNGRYNVRNDQGTLLGEMVLGTRDEQHKIIFYRSIIRDNHRDIERIEKVVEQIAKKQLMSPVIENKKIIPFSPNQINYLKYAA